MMKIVRGRIARSSKKNHTNSAAKNRSDLTSAALLAPISTPRIAGLGRQSLLATTALSAGLFFAVALTPNTARAQTTFDVTAAPNTVTTTAAGPWATTDTTNFNAAASPSDDRQQAFTAGGPVNATINAVVGGNGVAITTTPAGADVNFTNNAAVSLGATPGGANGGTAAVGLLTVGGANIVYGGAGAIVTNGFGSDALQAVTAGGGSVNITSTGAFVATGAGSGINAISIGGGTIIDLTGGATGVVGVGGSGISAFDLGGGSVSVTTGDQIVVGGAGSGVAAESPGGGSVTVTTGSQLVQGLGGAGNAGILAVGGVATTVNVGAGGATGFVGVQAQDLNGGLVLVQGANGPITGVGGDGVQAVSTSAVGNAQIIVNLTGTGGIVGNGGNGVTASTAAGNGQVFVNVGDNVVTGAGAGISAASAGGGQVIVQTGAGSITGTAAQGIVATSAAAGGTVIVTTGGGQVTGGGGDGITALSNATGGLGTIITVGAGGAVGGAGNGIAATDVGTGQVVVLSGAAGNGNIIGATAAGITAISSNGGVVVDLSAGGAANTVQGATQGIFALDGGGKPVIVNTGNNQVVGAGAQGILAQSPGAGGLVAVTTGAGTVFGNGGDGILTLSNGGGSTLLIGSGGVVGVAGNGINAVDAGVGPVVVQSQATGNGNIVGGTANGISAQSNGGGVNVDMSGGANVGNSIIGATNGIFAQDNTGAVLVNVNTGDNAVIGQTGVGVFASAAGAGGIASVTTGAGPVIGLGGPGVQTLSGGGGSVVTVGTGGAQGATQGVFAFDVGAGSVVVQSGPQGNGSITGATAEGILAQSGTGNVIVNMTGAVGGPLDPQQVISGATFGISALSATAGVVSVTTANNAVLGLGAGASGFTTPGNTTDGTGAGIRAVNLGPGITAVDAQAGTYIRSNNDHGILAFGAGGGPVAVNLGSAAGGGTISAPGPTADGIHATTLGNGGVTVTTFAGSVIGGVGSSPTAFTQGIWPDGQPIGHDGINATTYGSSGNVNVTMAGTQITAVLNGIAAYTLPASGTTSSSINIDTGANSSITALAGHGIDAEIGGPPAPIGGLLEPTANVLLNSGNITVNVGANTVINATSPTADGVHVVDNSTVLSTAILTVNVDPTATINAGHSAVFIQASAANNQTAVFNQGSPLHIVGNTGDTGGSGIDTHTFGSGGVIVNAGDANCANNPAICSISVTTGITRAAGAGILAYTNNALGGVSVNNFAVIDPPVDGIHAEIMNGINISPVAVTNNADITATRTGIFAGTVGLGSVTVTDGNIIGGTTVTGGSNGIYAVATNANNASDVTVNVNGSVTGNGAALVLGSVTNPTYTEISAVNPGPYLPIGTEVNGYFNVTGIGIFAQTAGTGNVTVHADGTGTITGVDAGNGGGIGIQASTTNAGSSGNILVTSNETINATNTGILATTPGSGNVTVLTGPNGAITGTGGNPTTANGIDALITNVASTATITVNAQGTINAGGFGINAAHSGTGNVNVETSNNITAVGIGVNATTNGAGNVSVVQDGIAGTTISGSTGINAVSAAGNVNVNVGANVIGTNGAGIGAATGGNGTVTVVTQGGSSVVSNTAQGILATAVNGDVHVTANGAVTGNTNGINALTTGQGRVTVDGAGTITGKNGNAAILVSAAGNTQTGDVLTVLGSGNVVATGGGNGIDARLGAASPGNIVINRSGSITTDTAGNGIFATTAGTGNVSVTQTGPVTTTGGAGDTLTGENIATLTNTAAGDGIHVRSTSGNITVVTGAGLINASGDGIDARSTGGAVDVTVGTGGAAGAPGVIAVGGPVNVVTFGPVSDAAGAAIIAASLTGNNVNVTNNNTVTSTAAVPADGIFATVVGGAGNVVVTSNNTVTGTLHGIHAFTTGTGNVTVNAQNSTLITGGATGDGILAEATSGQVVVTTAAVTGGVDGVHASTTAGGAVTVTTFGPVNGGTGSGIFAQQAGGNGNVLVKIGNTVTGATGITANAAGTGSVTVDTQAASNTVTGNNGSGIQTTTAAGANNVIAASNVTGTGAGNSGISATTNTGAITVTVNQGVTVTDATGRGVSLTQTGAGSATLNNAGTIVGAGSAANPHVNIASTTGLTTINNAVTGVIGVAGSGGLLALNGTGGPVTVNNNGAIHGRATLAGGPVTFNNNDGGNWSFAGASSFSPLADTLTNAGGGVINFGGASSSLAFGLGADTFTNHGVVNGFSTGGVTITGLETLTNQPGGGGTGGVFNVGNIADVGTANQLTEFMSFSSDAGATQTVTNSGTFNVFGLGQALGAGNGRVGLAFNGAAGSNFNNAGGLLNLQADGGVTTNAIAIGMTKLGGTSDLNYTYTYGPAYNFAGGNNSRLAVDTFLGGPGSTSDRIAISGNVTGNTLVKVNDTNAGAGALNLTGITVAAVGGSGATNFQVDPTTPKYLNLGPLGAINKGFFVYPLLYVPGGAAPGNAYKFFGLPGPFAFNLPVAHTAAQNIWSETALLWEDRQNEVRGMFQRGISLSQSAAGGGADLPVKARPVAPPVIPEWDNGMWVKAVGSWTSRSANANFSQISPLFAGLNISSSNNYKQTTYGIIAGWDVGKSGIFTAYDAVVFEIMGGYLNSQVNFDQQNTFAGNAGTSTRFGFSGGTVGGALTYMAGGFFASTLVKADLLSLNIGGIPGDFCAASSAVGCSQKVDSTTWGVLSDLGYRFQWGRYFLEPLFTVSWVNSHFDNLNLLGAGVTANFGDGSSTRLAGGFRTGGVLWGDNVRYLETSLTARVWDQVGGSNNVNFIDAGAPFALSDKFSKVYGETSIQWDWINRGPGWSGFVKLGAKYNDEFITATTKGGMRYQW